MGNLQVPIKLHHFRLKTFIFIVSITIETNGVRCMSRRSLLCQLWPNWLLWLERLFEEVGWVLSVVQTKGCIACIAVLYSAPQLNALHGDWNFLLSL